ncbi:MAG: YlbF family regulator [Chloroflexi bacterium]|nr:YlbF family regulator [Chloroflexota bacterium]
MDTTIKNNIEIVPKDVVMESAKHFAEIFESTPQFQEFTQAYLAFRQDEEVQKTLQEFQKKQASLRALLALNAVSEEDRLEIKNLRGKYSQQPSYVRYTNAQEKLVELGQEIGDYLTNEIGLDFGASCKTGGCCG